MKYRMYSLVLRQLNSMQKGVQTTHSVVEYGTLYSKTTEYTQWANIDKTLIILDGGVYSEMIDILETLENNNIKHAYFEEIDLINIVTSITFIADERVWNKKDYPDFETWLNEQNNENLSYIHQSGNKSVYDDKIKKYYDKWIEFIGGDKNLKLREIIFSKRLAQ